MRHLTHKYTTEYVNQKMKEYNIDYTLDEDVIDSTTKIKMHCNKCGKEYEKAPYVLLQKEAHSCSGCEDKRRFEKGKNTIIEKLKKKNCAELISEYTGYESKVTLRCLKNPLHIWEVTVNHVGKKGCPFCANKMVLKGDNSLGDVHPELIKYFKNQEDAFTITPKSAKKLELVCPDCGTEKIIDARTLVDYGFNCLVCSDKVSRPNKFVRRFLIQARNMNLVDSINFEWHNNGSNYPIDGSFMKEGKRYCIEMQGIEHRDGWNGIEGTKEAIQFNDKIKKEEIINSGYIFIEIECYRTDFGYMYRNFINNLILKKLFDFSAFDWKFIENSLDKNIKKEICEDFDKDLSQNINSLSIKYGLKPETIRKYLRSGEYFGWCDLKDNKYRAKWSGNKNGKKQEIRRIVLIKKGKVIDYFSSMSEVEKFFKKINGNKRVNIIRYLDTQKEYCGYYLIKDSNLSPSQLIELEQFQHDKQEKHKQKRKEELAKKMIK